MRAGAVILGLLAGAGLERAAGPAAVDRALRRLALVLLIMGGTFLFAQVLAWLIRASDGPRQD